MFHHGFFPARFVCIFQQHLSQHPKLVEQTRSFSLPSSLVNVSSNSPRPSTYSAPSLPCVPTSSQWCCTRAAVYKIAADKSRETCPFCVFVVLSGKVDRPLKLESVTLRTQPKGFDRPEVSIQTQQTSQCWVSSEMVEEMRPDRRSYLRSRDSLRPAMKGWMCCRRSFLHVS